MTTETRVYKAWSPFWRKIGSRPVTPSIVYKSIGEFLPLFTTKRACQEHIDSNMTRKDAFGLIPGRVTVTIEYNTANAVNGVSDDEVRAACKEQA